jgi:hypothetical protein
MVAFFAPVNTGLSAALLGPGTDKPLRAMLNRSMGRIQSAASRLLGRVCRGGYQSRERSIVIGAPEEHRVVVTKEDNSSHWILTQASSRLNTALTFTEDHDRRKYGTILCPSLRCMWVE